MLTFRVLPVDNVFYKNGQKYLKLTPRYYNGGLVNAFDPVNRMFIYFPENTIVDKQTVNRICPIQNRKKLWQ